jgi:hypothetical protein
LKLNEEMKLRFFPLQFVMKAKGRNEKWDKANGVGIGLGNEEGGGKGEMGLVYVFFRCGISCLFPLSFFFVFFPLLLFVLGSMKTVSV